MTDMSHQEHVQRADLTGHPDLPEMRQRYNRILAGPRAGVVDALVLIAGLYLAVSPWIVHFSATEPAFRIHNVIIGLAVAAIGLGMTAFPDRMYGLATGLLFIGTWVILSPWLMTVNQPTPGRGIIWSNCVTGGAMVLFALMAAGMLVATSQRGKGAPRRKAAASAAAND